MQQSCWAIYWSNVHVKRTASRVSSLLTTSRKSMQRVKRNWKRSFISCFRRAAKSQTFSIRSTKKATPRAIAFWNTKMLRMPRRRWRRWTIIVWIVDIRSLSICLPISRSKSHWTSDTLRVNRILTDFCYWFAVSSHYQVPECTGQLDCARARTVQRTTWFVHIFDRTGCIRSILCGSRMSTEWRSSSILAKYVARTDHVGIERGTFTDSVYSLFVDILFTIDSLLIRSFLCVAFHRHICEMVTVRHLHRHVP